MIIELYSLREALEAKAASLAAQHAYLLDTDAVRDAVPIVRYTRC